MSVKLKIMSFNLRVRTHNDGINIFDNRTERILDVIKKEAPALIGFQEANDYMRDWLLNELCGEYTLIGCGRTADYTGESTVLAYKTRDFLLVNAETFWLSGTPRVPGSRFEVDQSHCPRICTCATLKHRGAEKLLAFYNTHTDHQGHTARLLEVTQIMQHISQNVPQQANVVITGDMNATPLSPEIIAFTTSIPDRHFVDCTESISGTFHGFGKKTEYSKIDYIFTDAKTDPSASYAIVDLPKEGVYMSDHLPVCAYIELD